MTDGGGDLAHDAAATSPLVAAGVRGLAVRLVLRAAADPGATAVAAAVPFVVLHEGVHGRVLLAEGLGADGRAGARFVWKLRRDDGPRAVVDGLVAGNAALDAMWARERAELARVRSPHVVASSPLAPALARSAPVWWCRRIATCFHPVSPTTGARLRTCRDDALLTASGLPPYAGDTVRYVDDGGLARPATFYRQGAKRDVDVLPGGAQVRSERQLVRDLAALVHAPVGDAVVAQAARDLPCLACPHRSRCYPRDAGDAAIPAERELLAVSFHDVDGIALERHDLDFAEAAALLGGATMQEVLLARGVVRAEAVDPATVQALEAARHWLFPADPERRLLEVLRQKLALVLDVAAGLAAVHATGRPHLALVPGHVLVTVGASTQSPALWQLRASLTDLGSALPVAMPADAGPGRCAIGEMLEPGADVRDDARARVYLAEALLVRDAPSVVLPVACWRAGSPDGLVRMHVEALGDRAQRTYRVGDIVVVQAAGGGTALVACIDEVRPRGFVASALLPADDVCAKWDGQQFEARVACHRRLGPAADGHGLGALLLHALLVDDEQGFETVVEALQRALRRLADEPTGVRVEERAAGARLLQLLFAKEQRDMFQSTHLLHHAADRTALAQQLPRGASPVPTAIWGRVLVAAARALATSTPFAWVGSLADGPAALQPFVAELQALVRRIDIELFHRAARDVAIAAAASELAESSRAAGATPAASTAAPRGFRLLCQRDGDGKTQELRYEIDRVTIGRREGENLLRLNDPMVSSAHAVIESTPEGWVILDRNSTNGTEVDGIRLPVEVPQPLEEGSVVVIRPFRLTFQALTTAAELTMVAPVLSPVALRERLHEAFAVEHERGSLRAHEALVGVLREAGKEAPSEFGSLLDSLRQGPAVPAPAERPLEAAAARALQQLSRSLLGPAEFHTTDQLQQFVGKLGRFVDTTAHWIERVLELKRSLGKHLEFGITSTGAGRPTVRTAAEVRALVAGWAADAPPAEAAAWYVAKFYDDVLAMVVGLLSGNQQIRKAVRERLDPERLVEAAGREATLRLLVQAAAGSALWKHYVQVFTELTGGSEQDAELSRVLQKAMALREDRN